MAFVGLSFGAGEREEIERMLFILCAKINIISLSFIFDISIGKHRFSLSPFGSRSRERERERDNNARRLAEPDNSVGLSLVHPPAAKRACKCGQNRR